MLFRSGADTTDRNAQRQVLVVLLACFVPQIFFYALTTLQTSLLNAHRRFLAAAFAPVANNIVVIAVLLTFGLRTSGDHAGWAEVGRVRDATGMLLLLGLGTTAGVAVTALILVPAVRRAGVRLRPVFAWRDPGVRTLARLSGWTFGYVAANQIALVVIRNLLRGGDGSAFAYSRAFLWFMLPHALLAM